MQRSVVTPCKVQRCDPFCATAFTSCRCWGERIYHNTGQGTQDGHHLKLRDFPLPPSYLVSFSHSSSQSIKKHLRAAITGRARRCYRTDVVRSVIRDGTGNALAHTRRLRERLFVLRSDMHLGEVELHIVLVARAAHKTIGWPERRAEAALLRAPLPSALTRVFWLGCRHGASNTASAYVWFENTRRNLRLTLHRYR